MEAPLLTLPNDKDRDGATSYNYGTSLRDDETTLVHRRSDEWDQEPQDDGFVNVEVRSTVQLLQSMHCT